MLLNFQRIFARPVWEGTKRQTIRSAGQRKDVPRIGDLAHCYTGLRTRNTLKLGSWPIHRVDVIRFDIRSGGIWEPFLASEPLTGAEFNALAVADGFGNGQAMSKWFAANHSPGEFYGWVVGWEWTKPESQVLAFPDGTLIP